MEMSHRRMNRVDVLALSGQMMAPEAATVKEQIDRLLDEGRSRIILDMADLTYISSGGLRVLIEARRRAQQTRAADRAMGDLRIVNLPPRIKAVFDLTGFTTYFQTYDNLAEAIDSF